MGERRPGRRTTHMHSTVTQSVGDAAKTIEAALRLLIEPHQVTELRALQVVSSTYRRPHTVAGFFDGAHLTEMAKQAARLTRLAGGVYFTLNPLNPALLARRCNRTDVADSGDLASDKDVVRRRWLLIDVDPVRPAKVSATDAEKANAWEVITRVRAHLAEQQWPAPIVADSGNGYHLFYGVELPAEDKSTVQRILKALAARFDTEQAKVDVAVYNPARICKIPGTLARKGDSTPDRPHRAGLVMEVPSRGD